MKAADEDACGQHVFFPTDKANVARQASNLLLIDSLARNDIAMREKNTSNKTCYKQVSCGKQTYAKPSLTVHGSIKQLTQSTGSVNGDAGQNMMS